MIRTREPSFRELPRGCSIAWLRRLFAIRGLKRSDRVLFVTLVRHSLHLGGVNRRKDVPLHRRRRNSPDQEVSLAILGVKKLDIRSSFKISTIFRAFDSLLCRHCIHAQFQKQGWADGSKVSSPSPTNIPFQNLPYRF